MKRSTRMLLMNGQTGRKSDARRREDEEHYRTWYDPGRMDAGRGRVDFGWERMSGHDSDAWGPESRFRDRRGREHYDNGRYAPQSNLGYELDYSEEVPRDGYEEPWMEGRRMPETYDRGVRKMNPIGFARSQSGADATAPQIREMDQMPGRRAEKGHAESSAMPRFDRETAEAWTAGMTNEDGTRGPHWSIEQVKQVMAQHGMSGDPWKVYAVLNAVYSDYCKVFRKYGVGDKLDFYVDMAKAWLNDADAVPDKAAAYFEYVVRH